MEEQIIKYFGKPINKDDGDVVCISFQNSALVPLSIASTIKSKKGIIAKYFDVRQNNQDQNFIQQWLKVLFEEEQQVKADNIYEDPDGLFDIPVPILGFNSAHFDMIFVLPYLTSSKWHITNYLGDFSRIKRVEVRHKITGV
ncbi:MAG: hypothetical protein EZS28_047307, partial [Streblomastix strix]